MPSTAHHVVDSATRGLLINAQWLVKLRRVAVAGQLSTILAVVGVWQVQLRLSPLLMAVGVTAVTNLVLTAWARHLKEQPVGNSTSRVHLVLGSVMLLDLIVLTVLLYFTGGPANPFCIFYFVNLALAGVLLPPRWAWRLNGFAIAAVVGLHYRHVPVELLQQSDRLRSFSESGNITPATLGVLVAFVTCSSVIVYFATRLTSELNRSQTARRRAEDLRARSEKLEALGTLAAGAAHELATPLSTIAVVAKELQRELDGQPISASVEEDMQLIGTELQRCRKILDRMSLQAGSLNGEAVVTVTAEQLIDKVVAEMPEQALVDVSFRPCCRDAQLAVPLVGLSQAMRGLVQNAIEVSSKDRPRIEVTLENGQAVITILDWGHGMSAATLSRAGEPFFTTKDPGKGMGLGLFLARSVIERLGGRLEIESELSLGTKVIVRLPLERNSRNHGSRATVAVS